MTTTIVLGLGLGWLIALAVLVAQRSAQDSAWRAAAAERRNLDGVRRELHSLAVDLSEENQRLQEWENRLVDLTERTLRQDAS